MTKEEFIIECTMRNMQAAISASGTYECNDYTVASRCIEIAERLADKLYNKK